MKTYHQFDEIKKYFGAYKLKKFGETKRELNLFEMKMIDYYLKRFGLWLDLSKQVDVSKMLQKVLP